MIKVDVIISINVHEKIDFLIKQIKNIEKYVLLDYIVIINANKQMYNEITINKYIKSKRNIILNDDFFEKQRYHGSITKGIVSNMIYANICYKFKYFIILSSRNLFYNKLNKEKLNSLVKINRGVPYNKLNKNEWHWPNFLKTELSKYIIKYNFLFSPYEYNGKTAYQHEGLTFDYISCIKIIYFLGKNDKIRTNLFNFNDCVEEFGLQTISINFKRGFYQIGNFTMGDDKNNIHKLPKDKFVYKTYRI